jgi:hypothetical protein
MTASNATSPFRIERSSVAAIAAGVLIGLGITLQLTQTVVARLVSQDAWLFVMLFQTGWTLVNNSHAAAPWLQAMREWPLLFVVAGTALLLSHRKSPA